MKCEVTKLNDSAGLKEAGLEYRRKGHWELEAKNQQVFEAYNGDEKQRFWEDLNWRVEFQARGAEWWKTRQIAT